MAMPGRDWERLEELFTQACDLPEAARAEFVARHCANDQELRDELTALLRAHDAAAGFLDHLQFKTGGGEDEPSSLAPGSEFGAWRVTRAIGRGGMGEVYEVSRADGTFEQRAALKLLRREAAGQIERFLAERSILARLDHPGIARLFDGGVAGDDRPWAVLEYVEGRPITDWCAAHDADLKLRLNLFTQVCDAVASAHSHLIVHRDLKPSNILVDEHGRVRLLDFGIAKLLDPVLGKSGETTQIPLTPDYCAPEQLAGEPVTTATDVYALGLLLYELLTGQKAWSIQGLPIAHAILTLIEANAPKPSVTASTLPDPPMPARLLRGDLDAIVARCLRKEPSLRYATVDALEQDIDRYRQGRTVVARGGARAYVFGRFLRRYKWAAIGLVALILALGAGIAATTWQARRTAEQAARAEAAKNFLLGIFKASDPRIASDKPRGQITARELLDVSADRIEREFAAQPDLQIEMLGQVAAILRELGEKERYAALHARRMELARARYGADSAIVIGGLLDNANDAYDRVDYEAMLKPLAEADAALRRARLDQTTLRARWWLLQGNALYNRSGAKKEREEALRKAVEMYARLAPDDPVYVTALNDYGVFFGMELDYPQAVALFRRALAVDERLPVRNDAEMLQIYRNIGQAYTQNGDFAGAEQAFSKAADIARRTYGENNAQYWRLVANEAQVACLGGARERALPLFANLMPMLPSADQFDYHAATAREYHGECLAADGQLQKAILLLESALAAFRSHARFKLEMPRILRHLGDAYARADRVEDARGVLNEALALYDSNNQAPDSPPVLAVREQLGRFLLDQDDLDGAETQFREVLAQSRGRRLAHIALAHAGMARLALARKDPAAATEASHAAVEMFDHVEGFRDMHMQPYLWRVRAEAALASGDVDEARVWAQKAADAYQRYVSPESADLQQARATLAKAGQGAPR